MIWVILLTPSFLILLQFRNAAILTKWSLDRL